MGARANPVRCTALVVLTMLAALACGRAPARAPVATPPAALAATPAEDCDLETIIERLRTRYREARTYADKGTFREVYSKTTGELQHTTTGRFETRWIAPNRLRFELHGNSPLAEMPSRPVLAIWTPKSGGVKTLFLDQVKDQPSLDHALGVFYGVSHGTTRIIPRWLVDGGCGCVSYQLRNKAAPCGRATCFELTTEADNEPSTLYVDSTTYALRKAVSRRRITPTPPTAAEEADEKNRDAAFIAKLPANARAEVAKLVEKRAPRDRSPFDVESTWELDPTFDAPIDAAIFEHGPAPADTKPPR